MRARRSACRAGTWCLERYIGQLVDRDARGDLDERGGLLLERHEAGAHRLQEAGELRLQRVEDRERSELHEAATLSRTLAGQATSRKLLAIDRRTDHQRVLDVSGEP